jgi:pimeloyl-ACP methyl ester carboxylesterase
MSRAAAIALFAASPFACPTAARAGLLDWLTCPNPEALPLPALDGHYVELLDGQLVAQPTATIAAKSPVDYAFDNYVAASSSADTPLVLWFHGGLVRRSCGYDTANKRVVDFTSIDAYPIFWIWNSFYTDVLFEDTPPDYRSARANAHGVLNRASQLSADYDQRLAEQSTHTGVTAEEDYLSFTNLAYARDQWYRMKLSIRRAFIADDGTPSGGGYAAVARLAAAIRDREAHGLPPPRTVLIGHSMGSIFASEFIRSFHRHVLATTFAGDAALGYKFDVIFLAAAVAFDFFFDTLQLDRIANFRNFGMQDCVEQRDTVQIMRRSLLYAVSGSMEAYPDFPLVGMQRFWLRPNDALVLAVRSKLLSVLDPRSALPVQPVPALDGYLVWSQTAASAPSGYRSTAIHHGDFTKDPPTCASMKEIVANGFAATGQLPLLPTTAAQSPCPTTPLVNGWVIDGRQ